MTENHPYPRILNGQGCIYGQHMFADLGQFKTRVDARLKVLEKKLDRLTWALVTMAIGLATTTITLWVQYLSP